MVELLDPPPGARIIDPAAGTCGFLINSLLHLRQKETKPQSKLRFEWDGTPHRADPFTEDFKGKYLRSECFTGYENDQTMARIGWMNLFLHGFDHPAIVWGDSLSGNADKESGQYDFAFANPPYSGNVDASSLSQVPQH